MRARDRLLFVAAALAWAAALEAPAARADAGRTGAFPLQIPLGPRAIAMGQAFAAADGGLDSFGYNPAGIASARRPILESSYTNGIVDDHFSFTSYAHPVGFGVVSAGFMYYDAGAVHLNLSNGTDEVVRAEQDYVGLAGVSVPLGGGFSAGGIAKVFKLNLAQQASASGYAADAGLLWHSPVKGLNLGGSIQNLGPDVKFEQEGDPLPLTGRFGASYLLDLASDPLSGDLSYVFSRFLFTADGIETRYQPIAAGMGVEMLMPMGQLGQGALRLGYVFNRSVDSLSAGIGFRESRFLFDYALQLKSNVSNVHNFSIGFQF